MCDLPRAGVAKRDDVVAAQDVFAAGEFENQHLVAAGNGCEVECVEAHSRTRRKAFAPASSSCSNVAPSSKRADQYKRNGFDPAVRVLRESVPGRPILGHKQKWVAERRICSVDEAAGSMPRDTAGLELWVRNQSDFAGFRWCEAQAWRKGKHWPSLKKATKFIPS